MVVARDPMITASELQTGRRRQRVETRSGELCSDPDRHRRGLRDRAEPADCISRTAWINGDCRSTREQFAVA
jgi:hypothetical protein